MASVVGTYFFFLVVFFFLAELCFAALLALAFVLRVFTLDRECPQPFVIVSLFLIYSTSSAARV
jgi:hypothetical protein